MIDTALRISLSHEWVKGFGWERTVFIASDFEHIEELGYNEIDGYVFICFIDDIPIIIKGTYY